jgi:hypothetical protein
LCKLKATFPMLVMYELSRSPLFPCYNILSIVSKPPLWMKLLTTLNKNPEQNLGRGMNVIRYSPIYSMT